MDAGPSKRTKTLSRKRNTRRNVPDPPPERTPSPSPYLPEHWEVVFETDQQRSRFQNFLQRQFVSQKFAHPDSLRDMFVFDGVQTLFNNIGWTNILNIHAPSYTRPPQEILSSLNYADDILSFRLNNHTYRIHADQISELVGQDLSRTVDIYKVKPHSKYDPSNIWGAITDQDDYSPSAAKASSIIHPVLRVAHRILASIIFPREERSTVNSLELRLLYHMAANSKSKPHFGKCIGHRLLETARSTRGQIHCGGILTLIVQSPALGLIFSPEEQILPGGHFLTTAAFESARMFTRSPTGFTWAKPEHLDGDPIWVDRADSLSLHTPVHQTDWLLTDLRSANPFRRHDVRAASSSAAPAPPSSLFQEDGESSVDDRLSRIEENLSGLRTDFNTFHTTYNNNWGTQQQYWEQQARHWEQQQKQYSDMYSLFQSWSPFPPQFPPPPPEN
ncbi:hypothetical protein L2E82_27142 [Cichorium intybus]|uniref:Uncharacterized protein n=1 Tax=Cichorium intybus TaxID=13427 RepID=A0ACB9CSA2_CICIN|nr:hypothetical protein L2E82_27142 [Cichorium intybus]